MSGSESGELGRRIERLATERIALFSHGRSGANLTAVDRTRLKAIERELDECYLVQRQHRAARDAQRFDAEQSVARRRFERRA
jgi:hypothetical protein